MVDHLTEDQVHQLHTSFTLLDGDGDGRINATDLQKFLNTFNASYTLLQLEELIDDETCESNGFLDFPEFVTFLNRLMGMTSGHPIPVSEAKIEQVFDEWDTDGDGLISSNDLRRIVERAGELWSDEQTLDMIHYKREDGMLTVDDLKDILMGGERRATS
eukprot:CAMPEP_0114140214 /NCGR_PEP_ID=MMETSP0043_2-20121206/17261_1 /TAXON_ID=464988 /ORGANISM="Hemiselmis andersenii, Strain CCMP644" /LENGTH=159 /DNA_ID=CAMNT_0001234285 /DNA_START=110 /DNA_END=585 /DNA_ORIENTATION=-